MDRIELAKDSAAPPQGPGRELTVRSRSHGEMEMVRDRVEVDRPHQRDHARVEGGEVGDRAEDVAEGDVAAAALRGYGHPPDLLDLDRGGDRGVAEQALRDAEV